MPFEYITHRGRKVLYVDYSPCNSEAELIELYESVVKEISQWGGSDGLTLSNFEGVYLSSKFMSLAKRHGNGVLDGKLKAQGLLGITGLKNILLQGYKRAVKDDKTHVFKSREEALNRLVQL